MANIKEKYSDNVEGDFFVDRTCINCDTCRQLAPQIFSEHSDHSYVFNQPQSTGDERAATLALLCCPTGSIGTTGHNRAKELVGDLPLELTKDIYYCGFNSPRSYGGNSYLIKHEQGNWLVDSPKFLPHLVKRFRELGGIKYIFLTHRDDVADAARYAAEFASARIIHQYDSDSAPGAEIVLDLSTATTVSGALHPFFNEGQKDFVIIPTPGHTKGHMVLLYKSDYLFTGDHLAFDRETKTLEAFRNHCWYSWPEQIKSMEELSRHSFSWIFTGHGDRTHMQADEMHSHLMRLINYMKT
jgi:glyoxylase-like metal-dependent hydrolase (beta-lactamase superfamily II)/ferredoxin